MKKPSQPERAGKMGRRRWLRIGIGGSVALGLGGLFAWHTTGYELAESVARRLRSLTPKEYLVVQAAAARILRSDREEDPTADDVEAALFVDGFVDGLDTAQRDDFKKLLQLLEHGLPFASGHVTRFTRLDAESQDEVLDGMRTSSIALVRGAFDSLKSLCAMAYWRDPRTWRALSYDGPLVARPEGGWW